MLVPPFQMEGPTETESERKTRSGNVSRERTAELIFQRQSKTCPCYQVGVWIAFLAKVLVKVELEPVTYVPID